MRFSSIVVIMAAPIIVAIYTVNFGRWLRKKGNTRGAIGVFIIAAVCIIAPLALLILRA